jgi:hypothetical protein
MNAGGDREQPLRSCESCSVGKGENSCDGLSGFGSGRRAVPVCILYCTGSSGGEEAMDFGSGDRTCDL